MPTDRSLLVGSLIALVAAACFGTLGPLSRFAADVGLGAIAFVAWRALLGTVAVGGALILRGRGLGSLGRLDSRGRAALGVATTMGFLLNLAMFTAFGRITIALALVLFYTYPAMVAVVGVVLGRERLTGARLAALLLASAGVVLVLAGGLDAGAGIVVDPAGVLLALAAAACQTVFVLVSRHGYPEVGSDVATLVILVGTMFGAVAIALVGGAAPQLEAPVRSLDPWPIIVVAGVLGAGLPSMLFLSAIRRIGGVRTGILMLFEPVVGVTLAALLLRESIGVPQLVGGALVLGAAVLLQVSAEPTEEPATVSEAAPAI